MKSNLGSECAVPCIGTPTISNAILANAAPNNSTIYNSGTSLTFNCSEDGFLFPDNSAEMFAVCANGSWIYPYYSCQSGVTTTIPAPAPAPTSVFKCFYSTNFK